ncbi:Arginine N-succinyltransferase [Vibrio aerogenes CECT 7868]|uniref:Arginine N-succinyltransferase n=1 Tax=Vibrio aerogenes CECT 7868 TaxID=1216006 RepID=A0A1M5U3Y5_9VIBR|nr:arginine N-succinyltransferase [Vibrio aerogenes]SHH57737.1 Arginine N-succinyltransferase [Vibrio aerogenes CECT 7868]
MLIIRPIRLSDYSALYRCAVESGHGFTSLPENEELLSHRIEHSLYSFAKEEITAPSDEGYLMVGIDSDTGEVAGTTAIEASVGWDLPFYSYHIDTIVHSSRRLGVNKIVKLLSLGNNYTGCSELCSLFLLPRFRKGMNGKLMSKCRFLMMAEHPERFSSTIIAEMRGVSDEQGNSPFWQWLQEHFFGIDFTLADYLAGSGHKGFIADLMPKLPIYVNLLSQEAQSVIGKVHDKTRPALKILENEGFSCRDYVDIFDAGPTVECHIKHIRSVRESFSSHVVIEDCASGVPVIVSNTSMENFRATMTNALFDAERNHVTISSEVAKALLVDNGDRVRVLVNH